MQVTGKVRTDDKGTNQVDIVIEGFGAASLHDRSGREDYALLEQRDNPVLAARRTLRDPLVAHYHLRLGPETSRYAHSSAWFMIRTETTRRVPVPAPE